MIVLFGCASKSVDLSSKSSWDVKIDLQHLSISDSWIVTYKLPYPVKELIFDRQTNKFREELWKVITDNQTIKIKDNKEVLVSTKGELFDTAKIKVKTFDKKLQKDYEMFLPFSDGGLLIYTGHFNLYPNGPSYDLSTIKKDAVFAFNLIPSENEHVALVGNISSNPIVWKDTKGDGTYLYFGKVRPVHSKDAIIIIDSGLPKWVRDDTSKMMSELYVLYKEKMKATLSFKPTVFFSYKKSHDSGFNYGGGVLPGLVQLRISGTGWNKRSKAGQKQFIKFLGHESSHFWNGDMFHYGKDDGAWMHEGSAELFSFKTLEHYDIINSNEFEELMNEQLNKCIMGIQGISLNDSAKHRKFKNYYTCGAFISLISERAIQIRYPHKNIFDLWALIFKKARSNNNKYSEQMYFESLSELSGSDKMSSLLKKFISQNHGNLSSVVLNLLQKASIRSSNKTPLFYSKAMGENAITEVMKSNCGYVSIYFGKKHLEPDFGKKCQDNLSRIKVKDIGGYSVYSSGDKAYDFMLNSCNRNGKTIFGLLNGKKVKVQCKNISKRIRPVFMNL